jgi:sugar O-acyltransferase (sialic acid O-acetyltransferase NeuD family)
VSKSKNLYILGYSGHAYVVIDVATGNGYRIKGYFDKNETVLNPYDIHYFGDENLVSIRQIVKNSYVFPAIGSNRIRKNMIDFIESNQLNEVLLIDSRAIISPKVSIGYSTFVAPCAILNSLSDVGRGCIVNTGAIVEHESTIGDFTHVAPGAVLAGNVNVGKNVLIGANSVVKQGITIGDDVIVGAGAVVVKNIPSGETWVGNPAKML